MLPGNFPKVNYKNVQPYSARLMVLTFYRPGCTVRNKRFFKVKITLCIAF